MISKKSKKRILFFLAIIIICFSAFSIILLKSNYFIIKNINVEGNKVVNKNDILNLINVKGSNIFFIRTSLIKKEIKKNPYINDVFIKRYLPSTIIVSVKEREVSAYIKYNNIYLSIDNHGNMVQTANKIADNKPLIDGVQINNFVSGKCILDSKDQKISTLYEILKINSYKEYKNNIDSINIKDQYNILINTKNGYLIKVGSCNDLKYKLSCAYSIMNNSNVKGNKGTIEVSSSGFATFMKD